MYYMVGSQTEVKFISIYVEGNQGWFAALYYNALFCIDFCTGKTEYIGSFPNEETVYAYRNIVSCDQYVFFIPYHGNTLGIYDKGAKTITTAAIPAYILNKLCTPRFAFAYLYDDCLYMYGQNSEIIVKYDILLQSFTLIDIFADKKDIEGFYSFNYTLIDGKIYTLINNGDAIIEISPGSLEFKILKMDIIKRKFRSFIGKKGKLWLADIAGELYEYDLAEEKCQSYGLINREKKEDNISEFFWSMYEFDGKIYMIAMLNHASYIFDTVSKKIQINEKLQIEPHRKFQFWTNDTMSIWFLPVKCHDMLYFQWEADLTLRILDLRDNQLKVLSVLIDKKYYDRVLMKQKLERDGLVMESEDDYSLNWYLDELRKDCHKGVFV